GGGLAQDSSTLARSLGTSGESGFNTSAASEGSFLRSRPIPDQSAFSSSRISKGTGFSCCASAGGSTVGGFTLGMAGTEDMSGDAGYGAFSGAGLFGSGAVSAGSGGAPGGLPGGGGAGGPTPGQHCMTPRKSLMRCPPTPQRTPTWEGSEDSILLEGSGSGGMSRRRSLRQSKVLASGSGGSDDMCIWRVGGQGASSGGGAAAGSSGAWSSG
ncbi:unnamed protein product, partial [Discosporangium mesarthrocarpum]